MSDFVAIHLELTSPDPVAAEPAALAAVRVAGGRVADRVDLRARPSGGVPPLVTKASGLTDADVAGAPPVVRAVRDFLAFVGDGPVVSARPGIEGEVLRRLGRGRSGPVMLDVAHLARIVLPALDSFELRALARRFDLGDDAPRQPLARAELAANLWLRLQESAAQLSLTVIGQVLRLLDGLGHPLQAVFEEAEKAAMRKAFGHTARAYGDLARHFGDELRRPPPAEPSSVAEALDPWDVVALFEQGGPLHKAHPAYERRPEQIRMVEAACHAFNEGQFLMVEAGTGVGKSLAYLAPAILWSRLNREPVVVSTNTKNLQEQLFFKDIPLLRRTLGLDFEAALIKGRANYLCVRKFLYTLHQAERELSPEERLDLLPLVVWFPETDTGDVSENTGFIAGQPRDLWPRVSTSGDECVGGTCRYAANCFVRLARARAAAADVVVANHAVVFSDMGLPTSAVLPPYTRMVFDEAHNIENVATEHFARRVSARRLARTLARLNRARRDGTGQGLLASLRFQVSRAAETVAVSAAAGLNAQIEPILHTMDAASARAADLGEAVGGLFERAEDARIRYGEANRPAAWPRVAEAVAGLNEPMARLRAQVEGLRKAVEGLGARLDESETFTAELGAVVSALDEFAEDVAFCVEATEPGHVYWAEYDPSGRSDHALCAAPLDIRALMQANVYDQKQTVIFSSATLTVGGKFDFMAGRLGLDGLPEEQVRFLNVGTSFDFPRQALVGVLDFLPDPRDSAAFTHEFGETLVEVLRASRGRSLVLFTSRRMLRDCHPALKQALEPDGIPVLAQGVDGERSQLARILQENVGSVLLGVQSFWEGVDVVGEALSCLVLAKLPFQVHTDPIVEARCERIEAEGGNAFHDYTVPNAVIRLRQGFGRLIRTRTDRGVVIIADRRLVTQSYGRRFLASLPAPARVFRDRDALVEAVREFLA